jgi:hypothetical protein
MKVDDEIGCISRVLALRGDVLGATNSWPSGEDNSL